MNSKIITYAAVIVAIVAILSSAFIYMSMQSQLNDLKNQNTPSPNPTSTPTASPVATNSAPQNITLVDDEGYVTTLTSIPQRIISIAPSNTQILFAIGVGDKVVGVTDYDNYPYNFTAWIAAGNMTSVGGYATPNMETIATLRPDLILATPINDPDIPQMRSLGYNVVVINPTSVSGVYQDIALIGRATGAEANATDLINSITTQINGIEAKITAANITNIPTVYYEVWYDPSYLMSAGSTSWINDVIAKAGGVNLFANESQQYPTTSSEAIVQLNPSVILLPTAMGTDASAPFYGSIADVVARPGWNTIDAVKNNRIYVIDQDLFAEPGPRIAQQIQAIAADLYPQLFNSTS